MHAFSMEVSALLTRTSWRAGRHKNLNFTTKTLTHVSDSKLTLQIRNSTFSPVLLLIIAHSPALAWCLFYVFTRLEPMNSLDKVGRKCPQMLSQWNVHILHPVSFFLLELTFSRKVKIHIRSVTTTKKVGFKTITSVSPVWIQVFQV